MIGYQYQSLAIPQPPHSLVEYKVNSGRRRFRHCPNVLARFQLAESGSVPFLQALGDAPSGAARGDRAAAEGDTWLAQKLAKHAADEKRHGEIFAHALKHLDKKLIDFKTSTENKSQQRRSPFFAAYFEGYTQEQIKPDVIDWNVFMASTYILELDASTDFARMANVLPNDPIARNLKLGMLSIAKDETGHAAYLYEAMTRRMSITQAQKLADEWRTRKVNSLIAFAGNLLQRKNNIPSLVQNITPSRNTVGEKLPQAQV